MAIKKIGPNQWLVSYCKRNPKTNVPVSLRRKVESKAEAIREERKIIADVERKILEKTVHKWRDVLDLYDENSRMRGLAEITIYNTRTCLQAATGEKWGERFIDEITTQEIRDLIQIDFGKHATSHQKNVLKLLRSVFNFALEQNFIKRSPVPKLAFRVQDKIKPVLTQEQVRYLLETAKNLDWEWYPHVAMAVYTGMRNGELYALTWDKVNLKDRQILVDQAWNKKDGFKSTKSGSDRIVEIAPNLIPMLKELKLSSIDNFVLPHMRDWQQSEQARQLRMFLVGIGLPVIRFHDLRATWATLLLSKGIAPAKVMMMGGWKDMKTMMIYMRKAGIDIKGITNDLDLHDPSKSIGKVLDLAHKRALCSNL